jgi:hypothetical protein
MSKKELSTNRTHMPLNTNGGMIQTRGKEYGVRPEVLTDGPMKNCCLPG